MLASGDVGLDISVRVFPEQPWPSTIKLPAGPIRLLRRFNQPSGLTAASRVWWEAEITIAPQVVTINRHPLQWCRHETSATTLALRTESLVPRLKRGQNCLAIELELPEHFASVLLMRSELWLDDATDRPLGDG